MPLWTFLDITSVSVPCGASQRDDFGEKADEGSISPQGAARTVISRDGDPAPRSTVSPGVRIYSLQPAGGRYVNRVYLLAQTADREWAW